MGSVDINPERHQQEDAGTVPGKQVESEVRPKAVPLQSATAICITYLGRERQRDRERGR